jgi:hypothetical protein
MPSVRSVAVMMATSTATRISGKRAARSSAMICVTSLVSTVMEPTTRATLVIGMVTESRRSA